MAKIEQMRYQIPLGLISAFHKAVDQPSWLDGRRRHGGQDSLE